jgi:cell division protein FtsZ
MKPKTKIKVLGIGGSGGNAVSRMSKLKIEGVELIALNTDVQDLRKTKADLKLPIGEKITKGLGTGMNPSLGEKAALESKEEIKKILSGADMIFITCGMGGGTGTGASPVIAEMARDLGVLTVAVITKPFSFEGVQRMRNALRGIERLKEKVDSLVVINNDNLFSLIDDKTTLVDAFWICDEILHQAVKGISELIVKTGIINVDFADVKSVLNNSGCALFGIGEAQGANRAIEAINKAITSPLTDFEIKGAKGVLFNIIGRKDLSLSELETIASVIKTKIKRQAKIIFGTVEDKTIPKGSLKVVLLATGFDY